MITGLALTAVPLFPRPFYKYFPEVEAILVAWHDRHVAGHLHHLAEARDAAADPGARVRAVLAAYAHVVHEMSRRHHGAELSAVLHRDERVAAARQQLHDLVLDVLAEAARAGDVRTDVASDDWRPTVCRLLRRPAACRPRTRSGGLSRSP